MLKTTKEKGFQALDMGKLTGNYMAIIFESSRYMKLKSVLKLPYNSMKIPPKKLQCVVDLIVNLECSFVLKWFFC